MTTIQNKNRYLHKNDLDIKEFTCCIGISNDYVAIGTGEGKVLVILGHEH